MTNQSRDAVTQRWVKGLGGASVGLGLTEIIAPAKVAALAGVDDGRRSRSVIRALGVRECGHAAAVLLGRPQMVWTRVAGDALDLAVLRSAMGNRNGGRRLRGNVSTLGLLGITAADIYAAVRTTQTGSDGRHGDAPSRRMLRAAVTVKRPPQDVYRFWRELENLPSFMFHLKSVTAESDTRSHWVANAPMGQSVQWDAEITEDVPNERIAWQSQPGAAVENAGSVEFTPAPNGAGTEMRVTMSYHIPGGTLGKAAATLFGESPEQQVNDDLRRFKQILETGQVMRSDGSPVGTASISQMHQRAAQPMANSQREGAH